MFIGTENLYDLFTNFGLEKAMQKTEEAQALADKINAFGDKYYFAGTQWENQSYYTGADIMRIFEIILAYNNTSKCVGDTAQKAKNKIHTFVEVLKEKVKTLK